MIARDRDFCRPWIYYRFVIVAMTTAAKMALDVEEAKRNIVDALGDKSSRYWELLKNWYRKKVNFKTAYQYSN